MSGNFSDSRVMHPPFKHSDTSQTALTTQKRNHKFHLILIWLYIFEKSLFYGIYCVSDLIPPFMIYSDRYVFISFLKKKNLLLNCILLRLNRFQACCFQLRSSNDCINQALHCTGLIPRKIDLIFLTVLSSQISASFFPLPPSWQSQDVSRHTNLPGATKAILLT